MTGDDEFDALAASDEAPETLEPSDEPPVVARMIIEIRSDGSRTVARGAMEDLQSGDKVAIEARGSTPLSLALGLARSMVKGRSFARSAARALLPGGKKKP